MPTSGPINPSMMLNISNVKQNSNTESSPFKIKSDKANSQSSLASTLNIEQFMPNIMPVGKAHAQPTVTMESEEGYMEKDIGAGDQIQFDTFFNDQTK